MSSERRWLISGFAALGGLALMLEGPGIVNAASASHTVTTITWFLTINAPQNAWERTVVSMYEKSHPNIKVDLETVPYADYVPKLDAMFASGNPPDVFTDFGTSGVGTYYAKGMLMNLSPLMKQYHFSTKGLPARVLGYSHFNGGQYGIPFDSLGNYIFYNKTLFQARHVPLPPASWSDRSWTLNKLIQDARKLTHDGTNSTKGTWGILDSWDTGGTSPMLLYGVNPFNRAEGLATKGNFTTKAGYSVFEMWANMMNKWHIMPSWSYQQIYGNGNAPALFTAGRLGMLWSGGWELSSLVDTHINWGIAPTPYVKTDTDPTYTDPWFISKGAKDPGAAFQFIEFLTEKPAMEVFMKDTGYSPANQDYLSYWTHLFASHVAPATLTTVYKGSIAHGQETWGNELAGATALGNVLSEIEPPFFEGKESAKVFMPNLESTINKTLSQILVSK